MDKEKILETIRTLAMSKGFYGRLLATIDENPEWGDEFLETAAKNCNDAVDFVMWVEG